MRKIRKDIVYKELSYKVVGVLYDVVKELGGSYKEKYYQRAVEIKLKNSKIPYKREQKIDINIDNEKIGHHFIDFLIDNKIVLETKKGNIFRMADIKQVLMYLKTGNYRLGLLVYFGSSGVKIKRVLNSDYKSV